MLRFLSCLFLLLVISACSGKVEGIPTIPSAAPYQTPTHGNTPTAIPPVLEITKVTPTPLTYTVVAGDTLIGIASRFGITLQEILAANPGVQAAVLPVGTTLIIPPGNVTPMQPVPTPVPLSIQQTRCWTEADGGSWCFALVHNPFADTIENLSAQFNLLDSGGTQLASETAFGLLDILPPGGSMPLAVHFASSVDTGVSVQVTLLTAIRLLPGDTRYLPALADNTLVSVDSTGKTAHTTGKVYLNGAGTAKTLWVLGTAYDAAGEVVGVRRWDSAAVLSAGASVTFDFLMYSVGPAIDHVDFLVEARP